MASNLFVSQLQYMSNFFWLTKETWRSNINTSSSYKNKTNLDIELKTLRVKAELFSAEPFCLIGRISVPDRFR